MSCFFGVLFKLLPAHDDKDDRDKTPVAKIGSPPPAASSNSTQSTISRLENKYSDILTKIKSRKRLELTDTDLIVPEKGSEIDREKTLEADQTTAITRSTINPLSKTATVISMTEAATSKSDLKRTGENKEKSPHRLPDPLLTSVSGSTALQRHRPPIEDVNDLEVEAMLLNRYKQRAERDTTNRYKDTSDLMDSLKSQRYQDGATSSSRLNDSKDHYNPSSYYKSRYDPDSFYGAEVNGTEKTIGASSRRRPKSYRTRKEASKDRKHLTMKLSTVNMDIDTPPRTVAPYSGAGSSASNRHYKTYGTARKSLGTGLGPGSGYARSQTQKFFDNEGDRSEYRPPTERDHKRKEIQNLIKKYAQLDDEPEPSGSGVTSKSATMANLYAKEQERGSLYPKTSYLYDYPSYYGSKSSAALSNPYLGSSALHVAPIVPLSKTYSTAAFNNSSYLGPSTSSSSSAAALRSRKNLSSFVRDRACCGCFQIFAISDYFLFKITIPRSTC